jgi:hypothetical protein
MMARKTHAAAGMTTDAGAANRVIVADIPC